MINVALECFRSFVSVPRGITGVMILPKMRREKKNQEETRRN